MKFIILCFYKLVFVFFDFFSSLESGRKTATEQLGNL